MMKYLVMPDSFKGTMSADTVCRVIEQTLEKRDPGVRVVSAPVADGGEGTVDCILRTVPGRKAEVEVLGPDGKALGAYYGDFGDYAVIEMASAAGFLSEEQPRDPSRMTTFGVGSMIRDAIETGHRHIYLGLGGSCTNDGGAGMAAALGARFLDEEDEEFLPVGRSLNRIRRIDVSSLKQRIQGVKFTVMSDVTNPLYGPRGAAQVFGPQKGADPDMVKLLDENLADYAAVLQRELGVDVRDLPGGGAAGGMGAGCRAFLDAELKNGIDVILDLMKFDELAADADLVITGEGKLDSQSLEGKVISGILKRAGRLGIPVAAVCGIIDGNMEVFDRAGLSYAVQVMPSIGYGSHYRRPDGTPDYEKALEAAVSGQAGAFRELCRLGGRRRQMRKEKEKENDR